MARRSFGGLTVWRGAALVAAAALLLALAWRATDLPALTDPQALVARIEGLGAGPLTPLLVVLAFLVGGLLVFPVTALITVAGLLMDPLPALATATVGVMASATLLYGVGRGVGGGRLDERLGPRAARVSAALADRGVLAVATLRMLPVAPFSVVGVVVGASRIRFVDYALGTLIGMAPGIVLFTVVGDQLAALLADPDPARLVAVGAAGLAWVGLVFVLQRALTKRRARATSPAHPPPGRLRGGEETR